MAKQVPPLRRGWTTGACATAAAKAAFAALVTGEFPDPVEVTLPRGERPSFALAMTRKDESSATAGVVKDAGDDPDVTHGALVCATVRVGAPGAGVTFRAGEGVGTVTRAGPAGAAGRARHQSGAAPHDPRRHRRGRRRGRPRRPMPRSRFRSPAAKRWRRRRSTAGSASSAACRSSAPPASSCPIRARPGSIRSIPASMSRAPRA